MTIPRETSESSQTSATSQRPDYATWLTKDEAASRIGVSTKTIEQFAKEGKIQQAAWRAQNRGAVRAVYHPDDVERMAATRRPEPVPFVLPAGTDLPANGHGTGRVNTLTIAPSTSPTGEDVLRLVFAAALRTLGAEDPRPSQNSQKLFLTIDEAAVFSGLTPRDLRKAIRTGELKARHQGQRDWRTWRIRRTDLEAL